MLYASKQGQVNPSSQNHNLEEKKGKKIMIDGVMWLEMDGKLFKADPMLDENE